MTNVDTKKIIEWLSSPAHNPDDTLQVLTRIVDDARSEVAAAGPFSERSGVEVALPDNFATEPTVVHSSGRTWETQGGQLTIKNAEGEPVATYASLQWLAVRRLA